MSQENLDLVRSIFVAWERGDFGETDWADPEIEHVFADGPNPGSFTGMAGMAEGWREFLGAWENYGVVADEYRELDDERVLVFHHRTGRGKASGMELGEMRTGVRKSPACSRPQGHEDGHLLRPRPCPR